MFIIALIAFQDIIIPQIKKEPDDKEKRAIQSNFFFQPSNPVTYENDNKKDAFQNQKREQTCSGLQTNGSLHKFSKQTTDNVDEKPLIEYVLVAALCILLNFGSYAGVRIMFDFILSV